MDPYLHIRQHYQPPPPTRADLHQKCNRGSHSSDTSSAYSGSDTMASVYGSSLEGEEIDFSGLVESTVDSDEEDLAESMDSLNVRDAVRDCLEKDPSERSEDDVEILLEFTQGLKAFTNITLAVRRALCSVMVFAVVDKAGTIVMSDGEELDSWSVLINGVVEIEHDNGERVELQVGDSFGILPTMDKLYHKGVMRTKCDDCQFVCITQTDYYRIQHQGEENTRRHEDEQGHIVLVTELRQIGGNDAGSAANTATANSTAIGGTSNAKRGHVVIRGSSERLLQQLVEENSMTDPFYVEDFLLTHRIFIKNSREVMQKLLAWFEVDISSESLMKFTMHATSQEIRDRVTRVVLLWVNNHFTDFETDHEMMEFLEIFEAGLERKKLLSQLRLLHIACAAKARMRSCTLTRSSRDECLNFKIIGGYEMRGACVSSGGCGIYISHVERGSKAQEVGLKRGDQIHEVNGQSFGHVTSKRALEILMGSTHLSITVKSNLLGFKEMMQAVELTSNGSLNCSNGNASGLNSKSLRSPRRICANDVARLHGRADSATDDMTMSSSRAHMVRLSSVDMLLHNVGEDQTDRSIPSTPATPIQTSGNMATNFMNNLLQSVNVSGKKDSSLHGLGSDAKGSGGGFMTLAPKRRLQKALAKMNLLNKNVSGLQASNLNDSSDALLNVGTNERPIKTGSINNGGSNSAGGRLFQSQSNPDLTSTQCYDESTTPTSNTPAPANNLFSTIHHRPSTVSTNTNVPDYPEHVLKVYKADQTCKYLLINKETTAHEVVMLALQEFGIHDPSSNFSLCEVSVGEGGMVKQRRLPDQLQNLAERIGFAARYYLKTNGITETLVPDELALELVRESNVHFLQLNAYELAIQLTLQDFSIFRQIESTEYVDDLFGLKTRYGVPMLSKFSELVNREMFWVVTEICGEHNIVRRMKIVKQFIKIARHCKECRNFNSMFAIISGLGHAAVSRLRQTWEKLPSKYQRLFSDLQDLMDPSRNMSKYRQLVSSELLNQHPIIPFYPIVRKDLTFIHLGNDTWVDNLINFEKLRMIAKEVRLLTHMCSTPYDLLGILELKGQSPSNAMFSLNQMSTSQGGTAGPTIIAANAGQTTIKRRKKSTAAPNPKKMFEEAQMVRRVKAYLNNLKIINDEDILHKFSMECEPAHSSSNSTLSQHGGTSTRSGGSSVGIGGLSGDQISIYSHNSNSSSAPNSSLSLRKRHPSSPTLSTTSSTSSTSDHRRNMNPNCPKFGTASPQAVRKILSLSESTKIRPHQPFPRPATALSGNLSLLGTAHHLHAHGFNAALGVALTSSTPSPSPCSHRRLASGSTSMQVPVVPVRTIHERSHSDTPAPPPLPSVDLNLESSSVTTFRDLPLRKSITSGSVSSNDSGHGSYAQHESSTTSSVYTAADCRLLQQISNTATRNLNTHTRALSPPVPHPPMSSTLNSNAHANVMLPPAANSNNSNNTLSILPVVTHNSPVSSSPTPPPPPPPYKMRTTNAAMYHAVGGSLPMAPPLPPPLSLPPPPPLPLPPSSSLSSSLLSPTTSIATPSLPPPYATAAAMLQHHSNQRHSNMSGAAIAANGCPMCPPMQAPPPPDSLNKFN